MSKRFKNYTAKGKYYDLEHIRDCINRHYFNNECPPYRIYWGLKETKPESYSEICYGVTGILGCINTIFINPVLDNPKLKKYFLVSVVYHEMVHRIISATVRKDGKFIYHNRHFRDVMQCYRLYSKAWKYEQKYGSMMVKLDRKQRNV